MYFFEQFYLKLQIKEFQLMLPEKQSFEGLRFQLLKARISTSFAGFQTKDC